MKNITVQLSDELGRRLSELSSRADQPVEQTAAEIIRRRLQLTRFQELCSESESLAQAAGYASEDQILRDVS